MDTIRISEYPSLDKKRKVITSAKAYIVKKNKDGKYELFILHEKWPNGTEDYSIPGGSKEGKEFLEEALKREITEETGYCDFDILSYIGTCTYEIDWDIRWTKTDHLFLVQLNSEKKAKQNMVEYEKEVIKDTMWVDIEEGFKLLTRHNQEEYIKVIKKRLEL